MRIRNEFLLIAALGLALLGLILVSVNGSSVPLAVSRLLLGLTYVLFVPGYALQSALFPRLDELGGPERLALSFGLSVAVVPPMALILDRLSWGIRLWPIVVTEALFTVACSAAAWVRRSMLPESERFVLDISTDLRGWWVAQDVTNRILYTAFAGALFVALISAAVIVVSPKPREQFTEFYILGQGGMAKNYPLEVVSGESAEITIGIANREGVAATYRVEVMDGRYLIGQSGEIKVAPDAVDERTVAFVPEAGVPATSSHPADKQHPADTLHPADAPRPIDFLLYRDGGRVPYRTLRLWLKVGDTGGGRL